MHQTEHMSVAQAAQTLGVSRWTVVRLVKSGRLPALKLGPGTAAYVLDRADVERHAGELAAEKRGVA